MRLRLAALALCSAVLLLASAMSQAQTTFTNNATILLPKAGQTGANLNTDPGVEAGLYPSPISVSGMGTSITKLTVTINDFRHTLPDDIDMLLVGPAGQKFLIWSDVGGVTSTCSPFDDLLSCNNGANVGTPGPTITLDDAGASYLPNDGPLVTGTFKPTNIGAGATDNFPVGTPLPYVSPGPEVGNTSTFASVFNGTNPNGTWKLYIIDDSSVGTGRIMSGWSLTITTAAVSTTPTTTTISSHSPNPSDRNQTITVAFAVAAATGTPTGSVTVDDGVGSCSATLSGGAGSCTLALATAGSRTLTATYAGNATHGGSSGNAPHTVKYDTTTTLGTHTPNPSGQGQNVVVNYSVAATQAGGPALTGIVSVSDGVSSCSGLATAGSCTLALSTAGARLLTATYAGDSSNKGSTSTSVAHTVLAPTTTTITGDTPDPSDLNAPVTVTWTVTSAMPGTIGGTVTVADGFNSCQAAVTAGQCTIPSLSSAGDRTLTATYSGDSSFATSNNTTAHRVRYNSAAQITNDTPDPSATGQSVTVTFAVSSSGGPVPTGNVTVSDGVSSCTGTVAAATCSFALSTAGARTLTATYAGDSFNKGSVSPGVSHQVTIPPGASSTTINTHTPNPSDINQNVSVSVSVSGNGGTPTGSVTIGDGVGSCSATLSNGNGSCTLLLAMPGTRTLTASYPGNANFGPSSGTASHVVRYDTTTTLTGHTPNPSTNAQSVSVSWLVSPTAAGGPSPTGSVTVSDGVSTCSAAAGTGSCSMIITSGGARTLTATYAGDGSNKGSVSPGVAHTVTVPVPDLAITLTHGGNFAPGQIGATYSIVVNNVGSGSSSGAVTVADTLPAGLTATSIAGTGWTCSQPGGSCSRSDALAAGSSYPALTLTVNVAANAAASVTNVATLSNAADGNSSNNSSSDPTTISSAPSRVLDIDNNGAYDALSDALMLTRYLFGLTGNALTAGAIGSGAQRTDPAQILAYLNGVRPQLDIDGNGQVDALTDGILVMRYLFGLRGTTLTQSALGVGATRSGAQIESYLQSLMP